MFNESGQLALSRNYQESDNLYGEKRYTYNGLHQLVEEMNYAHVEGEKLLLKKIAVYDEEEDFGKPGMLAPILKRKPAGVNC